MYKNLIKQHLTEEKVNGLAAAQKAQSESGDFNKEYYNDVEKKMKDYDSAAKQEDENKIEPPKTNVEGETKEYHDQMEIRNGQEMIQYDNKPSDKFKERAEMALAGDPRMGNKTYEGKWNPETGEGNGNTEEVWGSSGGKNTGEEIVKAAKASAKKRDDAEYNLVQFGDDIENSGDPKTRGKARQIAVENKINNEKPINETKMNKKRLKFKQPFNGLQRALQLIPEGYRVDSREFEMTDGNETYNIRWEGNLTEGRAIVLQAANQTVLNEDLNKIKHLMSFRSEDTLGTLKGQARIDESNNNPFRAMLDKTRKLLSESEEAIEENDEAEVNEMENIDGQSAKVSKPAEEDGPKGPNHAEHIMEEDDINEDEEINEEDDK